MDPAQYKPTSQLLVEALTAQAEPGKSAASSQGKNKNKNKNNKNKGNQAQAAEANGSNAPSTRADLRKLLELRIGELKEERRKKQSDADKINSKKQSDTDKANNKKPKAVADKKPAEQKRQRPEASEEAAPPPSKRQRSEAVEEDDVETGRLSFEPRSGELPFEAGVNKRGTKVRNLRTTLRKEEAKVRKLDEAEDPDEREALRNQYALDTALRRAKGEKVHNDVPRLRKAQKTLETRKAKGQEKWNARVEFNQKESQAAQDKRKENLQARRGKKQQGKKGRAGFEGKQSNFLNGEE